MKPESKKRPYTNTSAGGMSQKQHKERTTQVPRQVRMPRKSG